MQGLPGSSFIRKFGIGTQDFYVALWLRRQWRCSKVRADCYPKGITFTPSLTWLLVRLQLQLERSSLDRQFKNPIDCARQVIRTQGMRGLWTGFTGSLILRSNFFWMFLSFEVRWLSSICEAVLELVGIGLHEKLFEASGNALWGECFILIFSLRILSWINRWALVCPIFCQEGWAPLYSGHLECQRITSKSE